MVAYRRYYIKGGTWFFTVNLKDRRSMHLTENIELLRYSVAVVKQHRPFIIDAWWCCLNISIASGHYLIMMTIFLHAGEISKAVLPER